jgi:hypothetical protein
VAAAAYLVRSLQLQIVEEIGNDPGWQLRELLDARREKVVRRDGAVADAQQRPDSRHRREPLVEHLLAGMPIQGFEDQADVPGVEDQVVDVEEHAAARCSSAGDQAVEPWRIASPADHQRVDIADQPLEDRQLGSREPRR